MFSEVLFLVHIEKGWCAKRSPNYPWDYHPIFKILPMRDRAMLPCSVLAYTEQIWMTKHFQSIFHSLPSRLLSWLWTIIIKVYWLFLVSGLQISETGNFKINKFLAPLIHTWHCVTLFFLPRSHFPQFSISLPSFLFSL